MDYSADELMTIINNKVEEAYTTESMQELVSLSIERLENAEIQLTSEQKTAVGTSLIHVSKLATKQSLIAMINVFLEIGLISGE